MLSSLYMAVPIHKQGEGGLTCGGIQDEDGMQPLEALLFTLDEINAEPVWRWAAPLRPDKFASRTSPGEDIQEEHIQEDNPGIKLLLP